MSFDFKAFPFFKFSRSDREGHDSFVLIRLDKVVYEISVKDGLEASSQEGGKYDILPVKDPDYYENRYQ